MYTLFPIGQFRKISRKFDPHYAPETTSSPLAASADVWALGMTLVETLTQQMPSLPSGSQADPSVPDTLTQPFLDIARHALRRDPRRRWTIPEIAARLNPMAVAAAAAHSVSPLAVPLSPVPAVPVAKLQVPKPDVPPAVAQARPPHSLKPAGKKAAAQAQTSPVAAPTPGSVRTGAFPPPNAPSTSASSPARGEVLGQILPDLSEKALATIHGVVRVADRVHVDP